ncbi:MAG: phosphohydrolase [Thermoprotei archaeon]|nr:MAG: phosphohydrolase [Thermoprotei archaeon]
MDREEAYNLVEANVKNRKLRKHMLAVATIMEKLAEVLGEDKNLWYLVGLLHDLDYEKVSDFKEHGVVSAKMLEGLLPEEALEAIRAHNEMTGYTCDSRLAKALRAADQLSGLIIATALVMPHKKLEEVRVSSLKKKFKQKDFARGVKREKIKLCEDIGIPLEKFFELGLDALKEIHEQLGL